MASKTTQGTVVFPDCSDVENLSQRYKHCLEISLAYSEKCPGRQRGLNRKRSQGPVVGSLTQ